MTDYRDKIDTDRCHFCPRQTDIEAHHIVPQRFNGRDRRENLVGVCERCHKKLEALYDKRFYEKLGITDEDGERKAHFECLMADCSKRAKVKLSGYTSSWYCFDHAVERARSWHSFTVLENLTDDEFPVTDPRETQRDKYELRSVRTEGSE